MTPSTRRAGAPNLQIMYATSPCSLGFVLVAHTRRGLCAILLGDDPATLQDDLARRFFRATLIPATQSDPGEDRQSFEATLQAVVALVESPSHAHRLPLDVQGTAFQQRVWRALQQIDPGTTATYSELATGLGQPSATRAVAQACGANPLAIAIPCHRVVRTDGQPSGYRWGLARKEALLTRERETLSRAQG